MAATYGRDNVRSAAIQGATKAFAAYGEGQGLGNVGNRKNNDLAVALSAEDALDPKNGLSVEPSVRGPHVRQLVHDLQSAGDSEKTQSPEINRPASRRVISRSPSHVAARIASRSCSISTSQAANESKIKVDAQASSSVIASEKARMESLPKSIEKKPLQDQITSTVASPCPRSTTGLHESPSSLKVNKKWSDNIVSSQERGVSSIFAAQMAAGKSQPVIAAFTNQQALAKPIVLSDPSNPDETSAQGMSHGRNLIEQKGVTELANNSSQPWSNHGADDPDPLSKSKGQISGTSDNTGLSEGNTQIPSANGPSEPHYVDRRTGLTDVSLADAIVASSLASSRASSPARNAPALPPRRRSSVPRSLFRHGRLSDSDLSRHESKHRGMRHTLRDQTSDESEVENGRRKHRHFMKHPNKHREGSRKRWKERVAERERKRYEGVWAANKGLLLTDSPALTRSEVTQRSDASNVVLDFVVRDIWNRSRLPSDTLAEIWDLVDRHGIRTLSRDEFVLGLWLIDQQLKGRKLPIRVSQTLWASVRHGSEPRSTAKLR